MDIGEPANPRSAPEYFRRSSPGIRWADREAETGLGTDYSGTRHNRDPGQRSPDRALDGETGKVAAVNAVPITKSLDRSDTVFSLYLAGPMSAARTALTGSIRKLTLGTIKFFTAMAHHVGVSLKLHRAVKRGNTATANELLRGDADVNVTDRAGCTPLHYALENPAASVELVQLLLDHGGAVAEVNQLDGTHHTLAAVALRGGDPGKLALVLERGADLRYMRGPGYGALLDAVFSRDAGRNPRLLDVLKILIARGVPLDGISTYGESALRVLSRIGRLDAIQLLLDVGADAVQLAWTPLHRAVALGTLADVKALVEAGEDLEAVDWWQRTAWLVAVKTGDLEKARYLVEAGADTSRGSPLDLAIESFHTPMLQWLIKLGVGVDPADCAITPLMTAVQAGNTAAVYLLIAAGADVDRETACGYRAGECADARDRAATARSGRRPRPFSFEGRRAILGLEPEPDESLFDATPEDFDIVPTACLGRSESRAHGPAVLAGHDSLRHLCLRGRRVGGRKTPRLSGWCARRFGQSLTLLPDGRAIQIGGEHEDFYDSDFCIYNDEFVHHPDDRIDIFCYPEEVFPPTDFHTATLIGDSIYIIGGLGYQGQRQFGETPVYRLDTTRCRFTASKPRGAGARLDLPTSGDD